MGDTEYYTALLQALAAKRLAEAVPAGAVDYADLSSSALSALRSTATPRELAVRRSALVDAVASGGIRVASRIVTLSAAGGASPSGQVVFGGLPDLPANALGYPLTIRLLARNNSTGDRYLATVPSVVGTEAVWVLYNGTLVNHAGSSFGAYAGAVQLTWEQPMTARTLKLTLTNTLAAVVQVRVQIEWTDPDRSPAGITWWGDSLTLGASVSAPGTLSALSSRVVTNAGVPGEPSGPIAARADAIPTTVAAQFTVPATSTPVACVTSPSLPTSQGSPLACTIAGIRGVLTYSAGTTTFTRSVVGGSVVVPVGEPVVMDVGVSPYQVQVVWTRNDYDPTVAYGNIAAIAARSLDGRVLVLSTLRDATETVGTQRYTMTQAANAYLAATYGPAFLNVQDYLASTQALTDAGLTPTANDLADIAAGVTPRQLRATGDTVHLTDAGYALVGALVYAKLVALGWL